MSKYIDSKVFKVDLYNTDEHGDDFIDVKTELMTIVIHKQDNKTIIHAWNLGGDIVLGKIILHDNEVKRINKSDPQSNMEKDEQWEESK
tara:strand:- start:30 stop:296 length:267 start_codon:yes stop_codon:yes gene_type:complete